MGSVHFQTLLCTQAASGERDFTDNFLTSQATNATTHSAMHTRAPTSLRLGFRERSLRLASPRAAERTKGLAKSVSLKSQRVHRGGGRDLNRTTPCKQLKKKKKVGCRGRSHHQCPANSSEMPFQEDAKFKGNPEGNIFGRGGLTRESRSHATENKRHYHRHLGFIRNQMKGTKQGGKGAAGTGKTREYLWPGCAAGFITRLHLF